MAITPTERTIFLNILRMAFSPCGAWAPWIPWAHDMHPIGPWDPWVMTMGIGNPICARPVYPLQKAVWSMMGILLSSCARPPVGPQSLAQRAAACNSRSVQRPPQDSPCGETRDWWQGRCERSGHAPKHGDMVWGMCEGNKDI